MTVEPQSQPDPTQRANRRVEDDLSAIKHDEEHLRQVEAELERDQTRLEHDLHEHPHPRPSHDHDVQMNYRPLTLHGQRLSGLQIKDQAIAAGIPHIQPNFHLTVERAGHDTEHTVGDNEEWTIHDGDCFTAVKPDDNS